MKLIIDYALKLTKKSLKYIRMKRGYANSIKSSIVFQNIAPITKNKSNKQYKANRLKIPLMKKFNQSVISTLRLSMNCPANLHKPTR